MQDQCGFAHGAAELVPVTHFSPLAGTALAPQNELFHALRMSGPRKTKLSWAELSADKSMSS